MLAFSSLGSTLILEHRG